MNWIVAGSIFMFLGVVLGAFGAHALKSRLTPELFDVFEVGVRWLALITPLGGLLFLAGWLCVGLSASR